MVTKFLICVAPSEVHTLHIVNRLCAEGVSNSRIRTFLGFARPETAGARASDPRTGACWEDAPAAKRLSDLGFPEWESKRCEERVRQGKIILCVQTDDPAEMENVMQIFQEAQGEEISSVSEVQRDTGILRSAV